MLTDSALLCYKQLFLPALRSVAVVNTLNIEKGFYTFFIFTYVKLSGLMKLDLSQLRIHSFMVSKAETALDEGSHSLFLCEDDSFFFFFFLEDLFNYAKRK